MTHPLLHIVTPNRRPITVLLDEPLIVGRDCDGLLVIDQRVSRRHASFEAIDGGVRVVDLDSANGTFVNGARIAGAAKLTHGDRVLIGRTQITLAADRAGTGPAARITEVSSRPPGVTSSIERVTSELDNEPLRPQVLGVEDEAGTLTMVFSDIEGSTELALSLGDESWRSVMRRHHQLVEAHVNAHRGRIVKNRGDGYLLCFRSARQALLASIGLQRDIDRRHEGDDADVLIRLGAHTGEVLVKDDGDLIGKHVILAARIAESAVGGQITVSSIVKQIAEPRGDIPFGPSRFVELKGIADPTEIFDVDWRTFRHPT